jgi:phage-related tail protein
MNRIIDHLFSKHFLSKMCFSKAIQFVASTLYIKLNDFVHQDSNSLSLRRIIKRSLWRANMLLTLGLMYIPSKRYHHGVNMIGSSLTLLYRAVVGKILLHWKQGQAIEIHHGMQE